MWHDVFTVTHRQQLEAQGRNTFKVQPGAGRLQVDRSEVRIFGKTLKTDRRCRSLQMNHHLILQVFLSITKTKRPSLDQVTQLVTTFHFIIISKKENTVIQAPATNRSCEVIQPVCTFLACWPISPGWFLCWTDSVWSHEGTILGSFWGFDLVWAAWKTEYSALYLL